MYCDEDRGDQGKDAVPAHLLLRHLHHVAGGDDHKAHDKNPQPAEEQKQTFDALLSQTLESECSLGVVQSVQSDLRERISVHKETHTDEPLTISRSEVAGTLAACGVSEEKLAAFNVKFDQSFGESAALSPRNLIDAKKFQLKTPDVVIQVNPDRSDLVQTRVLGGVKYILVCADEGVEAGGVSIQIEQAASNS